MFKLNFEDFLKMVNLNVTDRSHIKVLYETYGDYYIFYLPAPEMVYCAAKNKNELTPVDIMNLRNKAIPAVKIIDEIPIEEKKSTGPKLYTK